MDVKGGVKKINWEWIVFLYIVYVFVIIIGLIRIFLVYK